MLPHPVPSAEGTPFEGSQWKGFISDLEQNAAGDKPVSCQHFKHELISESMV